MFLNAKGTVGEVDEDIGKFLDYINGKDAEGKFTREIATEVAQVKEHKEMKVEYMTLMLELKQQRREGMAEGMAKGRAEGRAEVSINSIRNLMQSVGWTVQQAMDALMIPLDERDKYAALV